MLALMKIAPELVEKEIVNSSIIDKSTVIYVAYMINADT